MNKSLSVIASILCCNAMLLAQNSIYYKLKYQIDSPSMHSAYFIEKGYTEIILNKYIFGQYLIPIVINNNTYWFLLDTGANGSSIKKQIADSLKLNKLKSIKTIGYNVDEKDIESYLCVAYNIKLGDFKIDSLLFAADNKSFRNSISAVKKYKEDMRLKRIPGVEITGGTHDEFDGIIGDNVLSKYESIIDLYNSRLYLRKMP